MDRNFEYLRKYKLYKLGIPTTKNFEKDFLAIEDCLKGLNKQADNIYFNTLNEKIIHLSAASTNDVYWFSCIELQKRINASIKIHEINMLEITNTFFGILKYILINKYKIDVNILLPTSSI